MKYSRNKKLKEIKTLNNDDIKNDFLDKTLPAIVVENLCFKYHTSENLVLDNINFTINSGEYVTIIGHNGSGKSTLSKLLIGILKPSSGKIFIFGRELNSENMYEIRKSLGIVFQNPDNQFIGSTVENDIAFGLENHQVERSKMHKIVYDTAKKVNMENFLDYEPLMLSGGQKQRVAIASALALSSDILLFDESTSMLDSHGKEEIKNIMLNLKDKENKTILSITHDMEEILNADKIIVLNAGKIVQIGTYKELLKDPMFLKNLHLNIPFVNNVIYSLRKKGINLNDVYNINDLVKEICEIKK